MQKSEKELLKEELQMTWCKLAPSTVEGVGVFAICDIPEGTRPFSVGKADWIDVAKEELIGVSPEVMQLVETYCTFENGFYNMPKYGFKLWDTVDFLNHSQHPNVVSIDHGEDFVTTRPIKKGEELFIDYRTIDESDSLHWLR